MQRFSIGEVVSRTGVAEETLRMWERRHGFPAPARLASGHRRYSEADLDAVRRIAAERARGTPLPAAIAHARRPVEPPTSLYASLRRGHPDLEARPLSKPVLLALTHAIEEESLARAERPLLFGSFQHERFYRHDEVRWRELARASELTCVFADFERLRVAEEGPTEIPVAQGDPLTREWAIVCDGADHSVCLSGWEPPPSTQAQTAERRFETVWSVEPEVVRDAARACAALASAHVPELIDPIRPRLDGSATHSTGEQLRLAAAIANRALSYL